MKCLYWVCHSSCLLVSSSPGLSLGSQVMNWVLKNHLIKWGGGGSTLRPVRWQWTHLASLPISAHHLRRGSQSRQMTDKRLALQFSQSLWGTKPTLPTPSCPFRGAGSDSQTREMTKDSPCKSANLWTLSSEGCVEADLASFVSTLRPVRR